MRLYLALIGCLTAVLGVASPVAAQCLLCTTPAAPANPASVMDAPERPLRIEVTADLDFSRLTTNGSGGGVTVDPQSGSRRLDGDVVDLGGYALRGEVVVTGTPGRAVRITLPNEITLISDTGARTIVRPIVTNLSPAPRLDMAGRLAFSFGGRLTVTAGMDGSFRGRIPITADYE